MKNWRCRKTINMDEGLYACINELIPNGLQSNILGCILEDYFRSISSLPLAAQSLEIAKLIVRGNRREDTKNVHLG